MKKKNTSDKNLKIKKTTDPFEVHHGDLVLHPILKKWLYVQGIGHDSKFLYVTDDLEEAKNSSSNFDSASGDCDYSGFSRIDLGGRVSIIKQPSAPDKKDKVSIRSGKTFYQMFNGSWSPCPANEKNVCQAISAEEYPKAKNKIHPSLQTYKGLTIFDKDKTKVHNGQNIYLKDDLTPYEVLGSNETDVFIKYNKEESDTLSNWKNIYSEDVNYIVSGQTQACCIPKSQIQFIDADRFKIGDAISIDKTVTGTVIGKLIETQADGTKKSKLIVDFVKAPVLYINKIEKTPIKDYQLSTATLEGSFNQNSFVIDANLDNVKVTKRSPKTSSKNKEKTKPQSVDPKSILIGDKITVKYGRSIISGKIAAIGTTALGRIFTIAVDEKTNIHGSFFKDIKPILNRYNDCIDQDLKENTICFTGFRENDIVSHEPINVLSGSIKDSLVGDLIISSATNNIYKIVAKNKNFIVSIPLDNYHESFSVVQKDSRPHSVLAGDMEIDKNTDFSKAKSFVTINSDSDSFKAIVERKPAAATNSPPPIESEVINPNSVTFGDVVEYDNGKIGKVVAVGNSVNGRVFALEGEDGASSKEEALKYFEDFGDAYSPLSDDVKFNCNIPARSLKRIVHKSSYVPQKVSSDKIQVGDLIRGANDIVYKVIVKSSTCSVKIVSLHNYKSLGHKASALELKNNGHISLGDDIDHKFDFVNRSSNSFWITASDLAKYLTVSPPKEESKKHNIDRLTKDVRVTVKNGSEFIILEDAEPNSRILVQRLDSHGQVYINMDSIVSIKEPEIVKNTRATLEPNGCWKRVKTSGEIVWYKDKDLKTIGRLDGPAIENTNGYQAYVVDGKFHRLGGPAQIWDENNYNYFEDDKLHRLDGPACVRSNPNANQYFIKGKCFSKEQFDQEVAKLNQAEKEELKVGDWIEIHPTFSALNLPKITQIVKIDQGRVVIKCFEDSFNGKKTKYEDGFIGCLLLSEKDRSYRKIDRSGLFSMEKIAIPFKSGDYVETINGPSIIKDIDSSKRINRDLQMINTTVATKDVYGITRISAYNDFKDSKITSLKYPYSEAKDPLKLGSIVFDTESNSWCQVLGVENGAIYISSVEKDNQFGQSNLCDTSSFLRLPKDLISDHCSFTRIKKIKSEKDGIVYYPEFDANSKIDFNQIHQKRNDKLEPTKYKIGQVISQSIGGSNFIFVITGWMLHSGSVLMERLDVQTGEIIDTPKANFRGSFGAKSASNYSTNINYLVGSSQYQVVANSLEDYQRYCESRNHEQKTKQIDVDQQQRILSLFKTMISKMEENSRHLESNPEDLLEICNRENQELETIISDLEKSSESEQQGRFQFLKALTERGRALIDDRKIQKIEPLKPVQSSTISDQATEAAYRVGAKKISAIGNTIATKVLSSVSVKPLSNISDLLQTPLGQAFSSYLAGYALTNKFPNSPKIAKLVEEIRLNGMLSAQEIALDVGWDTVIAAVGDSSSNKVRVAIDEEIKSEIEKISEDEILDEELEENQIERMSL